jgi:hypothetical protein
MGDAFARKKSAAKKEAVREKPSCLIRASAQVVGKKKRLATVVDPESCDLFRKRLGLVFKAHILRAKPKKSSGSQ